MARYNVRDLLGHWNARPAKPGQMCPHACCRGKRVHPANFPVILPKQLLRQATDAQLADHYGKYQANGNARRQIEAEMTRRDRAEANRGKAKERARARKFDYLQERERIYLAAEEATTGHMLNAEGKRRGISSHDLFRMPEQRAAKYASFELLRYWERHPRTVNSTRRGRGASSLTAYKDLY